MALTDYGTCAKCGEPRTWYAGQANCAPCLKAKRNERYANDPAFRELKSLQNRAFRYGISVDEVKELLSREACDSCGTTDPKGKGSFHIDHDHSTGEVRGVLCHGCNLALGLLDEDVERILSLAAYIKEYQ